MKRRAAKVKASDKIDTFDKLIERINRMIMLSNHRRRFLREKQYTMPSSGDGAIMDLYALQTLRQDMGADIEPSGCDPNDTAHHDNIKHINSTFTEALTKIATVLMRESRAAVAKEAEHLYDPYLIDPHHIHRWVRQNELTEKILAAYNQGALEIWFKVFSYRETVQIFSAPFWQEADLYGGTKWAIITDAVRELDAALRRGNDKELMVATDTLLSLEHNTGPLPSKLNRMKTSKETLELRSRLRTAGEFKLHVSSQVAMLIQRWEEQQVPRNQH
jgi:hypothetical protein